MKKLIITATLAASVLCVVAQVNSPTPDGYRERGEQMFHDKNYRGCIDQMHHLKSDHPTAEEMESADYHIAVSAAHLRRADAPALLKYFLWLYPASPLRYQAMLTLGNLEIDATHYGEALTIFSHIDRDALDSTTRQELDYNKAFCLIKRADYDSASTLLSGLTASKRYANGARFYQGYIAYINGDYRRASELFRQVNTSTTPGNMAPYYQAQISFVDGDYSATATAARKLLNANVEPEYKTEALRLLGESEYHLGNDAEAIRCLNQYLAQTDTPQASSLYILGVNDYRQGDYASAIQRLTPVADQSDALGQSACLFIGQSMMQQGNYSSAMIAFEKASRMDYDMDVKETAYYNYAVARTEGGKTPFGSSVTTFEEFLRTFPQSRYAPAVREYIVTGYMTDNNYPAALASIEAIAHPSDKILRAKQQVLYTLGTRELAGGNAERAVERLRAARELRSHDASVGAETDLWLGEALYATGNYTESAQMLRSAIGNKHLDASNKPLARCDLGYALFQDGKYPEAITEFASFVTTPGNASATTIADAYNRMADSHYYGRDFSQAADAYTKAIATDGATADYPMFQKALMSGYLKDRQGKIDGLLGMIRQFPQSGLVPTAMLELGETYDMMNLPDKTIETYTTLTSRYPATAQARQAGLLMAMTYVNNGNTSQAIETYKNLISNAPTSDEARMGAERLRDLLAAQGQLDEYVEFINTVPGAEPVDIDDIERAAFSAAEREYLADGLTEKLNEYLNRYPGGAHRPEALAYAIRANRATGNNAATVTFAEELLERYPDTSYAPAALKAKADVEYIQGKGELALESYTRLAETAADAYMANEARLGIIRTARDLNLNDRVIEAAEPLITSGTVTDAQRSEAQFAKALALSLKGESTDADRIWRELAEDTDNVFGAKSAYYLAQQEYDNNDLEAAERDINALIDSPTPHNYWLARGFILLSDIFRRQGNDFEATEYLVNLKDNYPGTEVDIFNMIEQRLTDNQK